VFFRVSRARNRTGQCAAAHKNSPVDCFLARGRFPHGSPEPLQLVLEWFFVYPVRGIEQGSAPQRTKNSPVDCFLARGRFPRVSPKSTPACAGVFFRVSRARNRTRRCAGTFVRDNGTLCFWLYP